MLWLITVFIFGLIIAGFLMYLLLAPFYLEIDTNSGWYGVRFHKIASARGVIIENALMIKVKIWGWEKNVSPFGKDKKQVQKPVKEKKKQGRLTYKKLKKIMAVAGSFSIKQCNCTFDTGDMALNGLLYAPVSFLSVYIGKNVSVNFWGENEIVLQIENKIGRMVWAYIKT